MALVALVWRSATAAPGNLPSEKYLHAAPLIVGLKALREMTRSITVSRQRFALRMEKQARLPLFRENRGPTQTPRTHKSPAGYPASSK